MTDHTPMKTPARRPPGFPAADPVVRPAPAARAGAKSRSGAAAKAVVPAQATAPPTPPTAPRDPYAGAATKQVNTRLLEPLHTRYVHLVRELDDAGYRTSLTEILHALLEDGPETAEEARQLVRDWRRRRDP